MDFRFKKLAWYVMPSVVALALAGCGSDNDTTTPVDNNPPATLPNVTPPTEVVVAEDKEIVINFVDTAALSATKARAIDASSPYAKWNLHLWNNTECDALDPSAVNTGWDDTSVVPTSADQYGPTWKLKLTKNDGCINFIVRDGDKNKLIGSDMKVVLANDPDRTISIVAGKSTIYKDRAEAFQSAFGVAQASAHLVDAETLLWDGGKGKAHVRIYTSKTGNIGPDAAGVFTDPFIELTSTTLSDEQKAAVATKYNHIKDLAAFKIPAGTDLKNLLKGEVVALATDDKGVLQAATLVQFPGALDALYATKAAAQEYGAIVSADAVTFRLWAPTAQNVKLAIYDDKHQSAGLFDMVPDAETGAWSYSGSTDLKNKFYRYEMDVYHPLSRTVEHYEVTDPYSLSLAMNSEYSQVIDLEDPELKPEGWDDLQAPHKQLENPAKIVTLETHIRDFSAMDQSTPAEHRGKYMAFTDTDSVPVKHMKELAANGVTHMHLMPTFDIATVNEDPAKVANLSDPFSKLCDVNPAVKDSEFKDKCSSNETIESTLESLKTTDSKSNPVIQKLYGYIRGVDSFNWGYDPFHYTVPEGSYATDGAIEGAARIKEFREMVKSIKQNIGMNVVMDVVYNHTNESGLGKKSVLDKIVPWYYQRLNEVTGNVETSTCCSNTAPEHAMFAKLIEDSLATWTKEYKIDSFRFDLMGFHPLAQSTKALEKTRAINPDMFFYAEGWDFGETAKDRRFVTTTQPNTGGTGISTYSDRARDAVRGGSPFDSGDGIRQTQGFGNGAYVLPNEAVTKDDALLSSALHQSDLTMLGMAGNLKTFTLVDKNGQPVQGSALDYNGQKAGYAVEPWEVLNYVTKHDNQTIWDNINYKVATDVSLQDRVKMQAISIATAMLGQGIPFTDIGSELLRSKSFERDSFDSGDWYNKVDYTLEDNNFDKGYPRSDKDEANYSLIEKVLKPEMKPTKADMQQMVSYFKELTRLRKDNPLLTLGKGEEVMKRVDFRNVGPEQVPGLIVMTIDDGVSAGADMDSANDAAVVIINATPGTQIVGNFKDGDDQTIALDGFQLSAAHSSENSIAGDASFANGEFSVPAWSAAVFVKPQGSARGTGLPVSKKQDPSTVEPFSVPVYARGFLGDWGTSEANQFIFTGAAYSYEFKTEVTSAQLGSTQVKVADEFWGDTEKGGKANFGKCSDNDKLAVGTPLTLCAGGGDIPLDMTKVGTYHFIFKVMNKDKPTLTLAIDEPAAACALLPDSTEAATLGETKLALRGNHSSWNWDAAYQLSYKGSGIYEAKVSGVDLSGGFKIAADTSNWDPQFFATSAGTLAKPMVADTVYEAYGRFGGAGTDPGNNTMTLGAGNWLFRLKLDTTAEMTGAGVKGTIDVCQLP